MRTKNLILGFCATTLAATGAIAAFASKTVQGPYYVKIGTEVQLISTSPSFLGCSGSGLTCRVKLVRPNNTVITESTTVYTNTAGTIAAQSSDGLAGTVVIQ